MPMKCYGYLDIETTGLSRQYAELTVVGIATVTGTSLQVAQLYGGQIAAAAVARLLEPVDEVYTYNGSRFDLPFIRHKLGLDVKGQVAHTDLMYDCWRRKLKGGLKAVEKRLGICRKLPEVNGYMAVQLWWQYVNNNNPAALRMLLTYNQEDIVNLHTLRKKLGVA
ncbi:MAG: ribonuclease H-like domain-containing protein [Sedimentisphaerales bacterium]|nr:ribonuclease H-like domain-containing protein [Sedimentisphaerales bacterium]